MDRVDRFVEKEIGKDVSIPQRSKPLFVSAAFQYLKEAKRRDSQLSRTKFEVSAIERFMRGKRLADDLEGGAAVYMAAVLDYLAAEVLELAGDVARKDEGRSIIAPHHLKTAIQNDEELKRLLTSISVVPPEKEKKPTILESKNSSHIQKRPRSSSAASSEASEEVNTSAKSEAEQERIERGAERFKAEIHLERDGKGLKRRKILERCTESCR